MDSFLGSIEKLASKSGAKREAGKSEVAKKKHFFPNQTLLATCSKIFDICKISDSGAGSFFKLAKHNANSGRSEARLFGKSKIRKKIRDNVFSFRRQKKFSPILVSANSNKVAIIRDTKNRDR